MHCCVSHFERYFTPVNCILLLCHIVEKFKKIFHSDGKGNNTLLMPFSTGHNVCRVLDACKLIPEAMACLL